MTLKEGDEVLLPQYGGQEFKIEEDEFILLREPEIIAKLEDNKWMSWNWIWFKCFKLYIYQLILTPNLIKKVKYNNFVFSKNQNNWHSFYISFEKFVFTFCCILYFIIQSH